MSEDLLLLFAYHFPPENAIGGVRPFRFYKYLPRLGLACHVITAADVRSRPELQAEYVPDPFITRPRQGVGWQIERFIRKFFLPGVTGTHWAVDAYRAGLKLLVQNPRRRVAVLSTYPPLGTLLAGFLLARKAGLPWILDFRDPLAGNPQSGDINDFQRQIYRRIERLFVRRAAQVIANTDAAERMLKQAYPNRVNDIHLISNGFDPEDRLSPDPIPDRPYRVFSHVGGLYEGRSVTPLLESVKRLIDSGQLNQRQIKILLVGPARHTSIPDASFLEQATSAGWLETRFEGVPQEEAESINRTSDGLLLIQPGSAVQIPGKLYEYLQIGRPILAVMPPDSAIERVLCKSGITYRCAYSTSPADVFDAAVREYFNLPSTTEQPSEWFENEFNAQRHTEKLARIIEAAHAVTRP